MDFYSLLSKYYDEVFPAKEPELRFVSSLLDGCTELLDIGCGTGNKTAILAKGRRAAGFDMDPEMVARASAAHAGANLHFFALDMRDIASVLSPGSFDAAVCLGNTLAHLHRDGELTAFFRQVHTVLRTGGVFVGQILNYDRIVDKQVAALPLIDTPNVRFERNYEWREGQLRFVTRITDKHTSVAFDNDIPLRPILRAAVDSVLAANGFGVVEHYGSYSGEPFREAESFHLIFKSTALPGGA